MAQFLVEEMKTKYLSEFAQVKTEECRPAKNMNIKCEDCILKCEDCKSYLGCLFTNLQMSTQFFSGVLRFLGIWKKTTNHKFRGGNSKKEKYAISY